MKFVNFLSLKRMTHRPSKLWPEGVDHLVVLFFELQNARDTLVAIGIASDHAARRRVFEVLLPRKLLSAFIAAVIAGDDRVIQRDCGHISAPTRSLGKEHAAAVASGAHVVSIARDLPDRELRTLLALATAIRSDETLFDLVAHTGVQRGYDQLASQP